MKNLALKRITCILFSIISVICYAVISGVRLYDETLLKAERLTKALLRQDNSKQNIDMTNAISATYIKDAEEEEAFVLASGSNSGYAIFSKEDLQLIEYSPYGSSPYNEIDSDKAIYAGVGNYLEKKGKDVKNIYTQKKYNKEELKEIKKGVKNKVDKIKEKNKKSKVTLTSNIVENGPGGNVEDVTFADNFAITSRNLIPNYKYFQSNLQFHNNQENSCTTVAGQILLAYNNWANDGRLITNTEFLYNYSDNNPKFNKPYYAERTSTSEAFFNCLFEDIGPMAPLSKLDYGVQLYLNNYVAEDVKSNISKSVYLFDVPFHIRESIDNGFPCVASISFIDDNIPALHSVVVYGYQSVMFEDNISNGFIAHFGWSRKESYVWFDESWVYESFSFFVDHSHSDVLLDGSQHIVKCNTCNRIKTNSFHIFNTNINLNNYGPEHHFYCYNNLKETNHISFCDCGVYELSSHNYVTYSIIYDSSETNNFHYSICGSCGYQGKESHFIKYGYCYYCGYIP